MASTPHNAQYTKSYNRNLILRLLLTGPMSRAELARQTGLSRQTITNIVDELLADGWVAEAGSSRNRRGRTAMALQVRGDACYSVGIFLSREGCRVGLVNFEGRVLDWVSLNTTPKEEQQGVLNKLPLEVQGLIERSGVPKEKVLGIGISAPGPLQQQSGVILNPPGFSKWHNTNLVTPLQEKTGLPTLLDNNAYALAVYEKQYGNGKQLQDFMLLLVDSGVGCGIISGGHLFQGAHRQSGEIGHTSINLFGERCPCGNFGCLELYAAIPNLLRRFSVADGSWTKFVRLVKARDEEAMRVLEKEADYLVAGMVNAVNMLDLQAVLLDGDIVDVYAEIAPYMEKQLNAKTVTRSFGSIGLYCASTRENHALAAAANIVFHDAFR